MLFVAVPEMPIRMSSQMPILKILYDQCSLCISVLRNCYYSLFHSPTCSLPALYAFSLCRVCIFLFPPLRWSIFLFTTGRRQRPERRREWLERNPHRHKILRARARSISWLRISPKFGVRVVAAGRSARSNSAEMWHPRLVDVRETFKCPLNTSKKRMLLTFFWWKTATVFRRAKNKLSATSQCHSLSQQSFICFTPAPLQSTGVLVLHIQNLCSVRAVVSDHIVPVN